MPEILVTPQLIHLRNDRISYCLGILEGGYVAHLYFGPRLAAFSPASVLRRFGLREDMQFSPNNCALNHVPQEYPSFGLGDMKEGAFAVQRCDGTESCDLRFEGAEVLPGKPALPGLPASFAGEGEASTLKLHMSDALLGLRVTLLYTVFDDCDVIARSAMFENLSGDALRLEQADSLCLDLPDAAWELMTLTGDWARERSVVRRPLCEGFQGVESLRGASSLTASPFAALLRPGTTEQLGEVIASALVYSGNFRAGAEVDCRGMTRLRLGLNARQFSWNLNPGEVFQTPEAVLVYSAEGLSGMSAQFHALCRDHLV
ncbi:MAG: alpha-galactosidase, partial [Clostridia bacterium]|nr:alpha-galactosidase [Clostridia bacterium]